MLAHRVSGTAMLIVLTALAGAAFGDELTQIIQQDLVTLGYDPGNTDGEATVTTIVAISKFQAEHDLEVTGEATPQLAGVIKATISQSASAGASPPAAPVAAAAPESALPAAAPAADPATLRAAQQECLQQRANEAQASQQRKRGFARLARAVSRTASRFGNDDVSNDIASFSAGVYEADAIAGDFKGAAEDLGLSESDVEACRNPL